MSLQAVNVGGIGPQKNYFHSQATAQQAAKAEPWLKVIEIKNKESGAVGYSVWADSALQKAELAKRALALQSAATSPKAESVDFGAAQKTKQANQYCERNEGWISREVGSWAEDHKIVKQNDAWYLHATDAVINLHTGANAKVENQQAELQGMLDMYRAYRQAGQPEQAASMLEKITDRMQSMSGDCHRLTTQTVDVAEKYETGAKVVAAGSAIVFVAAATVASGGTAAAAGTAITGKLGLTGTAATVVGTGTELLATGVMVGGAEGLRQGVTGGIVAVSTEGVGAVPKAVGTGTELLATGVMVGGAEGLRQGVTGGIVAVSTEGVGAVPKAVGEGLVKGGKEGFVGGFLGAGAGKLVGGGAHLASHASSKPIQMLGQALEHGHHAAHHGVTSKITGDMLLYGGAEVGTKYTVKGLVGAAVDLIAN